MLFSKEEVNIGRQTEADIAKFVCMVGMVIVHCFDTFVSFSELTGTVEYIFGMVLNSIFGAGTFMFCMGMGIAYSRNASPAALIRRGGRIILIGYALNLACALSYLILLRDIGLFITYLFGSDILQFAGLALILFGLLLKLDASGRALAAAAVLMSAAGSFLRTLDLGNIAANIFFGLFIGTFDYEWMTGGIFPLFNWFIFVAAGYFFALLLRRCTEKGRLYALVSGVSGIIVAVYMLIAIPKRLGMMGSVLRLHQIETHEALVCVAGALFALGVYHALTRVLPEKLLGRITAVSRNINTIYCAQWIIIAWTVSLWVLGGEPVMTDGMIILAGLVIFTASALAAELLKRIKHGKGV